MHFVLKSINNDATRRTEHTFQADLLVDMLSEVASFIRGVGYVVDPMHELAFAPLEGDLPEHDEDDGDYQRGYDDGIDQALESLERVLMAPESPGRYGISHVYAKRLLADAGDEARVH